MALGIDLEGQGPRMVSLNCFAAPSRIYWGCLNHVSFFLFGEFYFLGLESWLNLCRITRSSLLCQMTPYLRFGFGLQWDFCSRAEGLACGMIFKTVGEVLL